MNKKIENEFVSNTFFRRENNSSHSPYEQELMFFQAVKDGNMEYIEKNLTPLSNEHLGELSKDSLRNLQYHLVITIALITRFCIEGGMDYEAAYTLSDIYIQKADLCKSTDEIAKLHKKMIYEYVDRMSDARTAKAKSLSIVLCLDYIYNHLHSPVHIKDLANIANLNPTYLSTLFKKEMNVTITAYIQAKRIEAAKNMLKFSTYSSVDISNYLGFNSHSYFIKVFKQQVGMTPNEYSKKYFRQKWK